MHATYPLKVILPLNYPVQPPCIYFDTPTPLHVLQQLPYMVAQKGLIETPLIQNWDPSYMLLYVLKEVVNVVT